MQTLIILVALGAIAIGSYTDVKKREVADWVNYSLIAFGFGANILYSLAFWTLTPLIFSLIGFGVFFAIAYAMFYTGQWGGGDSKMIFGLGALLGLSYPFKIDFFVKFLINMLFAGALYVMSWAIISGIKNRINPYKFCSPKKVLPPF